MNVRTATRKASIFCEHLVAIKEASVAYRDGKDVTFNVASVWLIRTLEI